MYANLIQKISGVHSVRWRVKDCDHVLEKIIRKRAAGEPKYADVCESNYFSVVTDLVGIRALHLFKDDCFEIHKRLIALWDPVEAPVAYIRSGDPQELIEKYAKAGLEVKEHPAGYRSVHYVFASQPLNRKVISEVQIRTIFEEGWSEIDHTIRYPNFSENELVGYFLTIFNRMAGSADEMGSFVRGLAATIQGYQLQISQASVERDASLKSMEDLVEQLDRLKQQDKDSKGTIDKLKAQIDKMKGEQGIAQIFSGQKTSGGIQGVLYGSPLDKLFRDIEAASSALKHLDDASATSGLAKLMQSHSLDVLAPKKAPGTKKGE